MLGARISPKAQYGLRLLAKIQGRTIADAVEWSINLALRSTRVGAADNETRLHKIVDEVWSKSSEPRQVFYLDRHAPELLDFEQRSAWALVKRCKDLWVLRHYQVIGDDEGPTGDIEVESESEADHSHREARFDLIEQHWETLRKVGAELIQAGDLETVFTLDEIVSGKALEKAGIA